MADESTFTSTIVSTIVGSPTGKSMPVKDLRKAVLLSLQLDVDDKKSKKKFKKAVQAMESDGKLTLSDDGIVKLSKSARKEAKSGGGDGDGKKKKKDKKKKRKQSDDEAEDALEAKKKQKKSADDDDDKDYDNGDDDDGDEPPIEGDANDDDDDESDGDDNANGAAADDADTTDPSKKNKPCKGNPTGVTRLFLGNLPFAVDESSLNDFLGGHMTHVKWITDKETGRFYGSAFVEMRNSKDAGEAVAKAGQDLMGRSIKINFAAARPGDMWPPKQRAITGGKQAGGGGQAGGFGTKAMSEKPEGCVKLFIGNLSYDIDDDAITKFFANVDAELKAVRWLHHKDTGDFKGVGFVEFWNTEACEKAATLNGKNLLGRPIRIDWTD
jgi:nucleolin